MPRQGINAYTFFKKMVAHRKLSVLCEHNKNKKIQWDRGVLQFS